MEEENKEGEKRRGKKRRFFFSPAHSVFVSGCLAVSLGRDRQTAQERAGGDQESRGAGGFDHDSVGTACESPAPWRFSRTDPSLHVFPVKQTNKQTMIQ